MQTKLVSRISMVAIPIMIVCGLLVAPSSLRVAASSPQADDGDIKACSNRTLHGDYGFAVEGLLLPAPGVALPGRGVTMTHFDGEGNLTQVDSLIINGTPVSDWSPVTGTYHVNANCTGTMSLLPGAGSFVNLRIVVVRHGTEIHTVVWPPFDGPNRTVTSVGIKVE